MLRGYGLKRARGVRSADALRRPVGNSVDYSRGCGLHHGSHLLLSAQAALYAHRVPLLCACRLGMPHHSRMGYNDEMAVDGV